jgi:uroporphyrinogen-III decarboxylase
MRCIFREDPPRELFVELFGPLIGLEEEWAAQGASPEQIGLSTFCFDRLNVVNVPGLGIINPLPDVTLEEDDKYLIQTDYLGRTVKLCKDSATIPLPMDFPVKNMDDWLRLKPMFAWSEERLAGIGEQAAWLTRERENGALVLASISGGFDVIRELMGEENACLAYYDQPELIHEILETVSEANVRVLDAYSSAVTIDQLSVHEDLAGKSGPLVGPNIVDEFIRPYYRRSWDLLEARGTGIFCQDSDGNMNPVVESFIRAGVNQLLPCEPAAGMDVVALRKKYGPALTFKGGIDKHVLRGSFEDIRKELTYKMQPGMLGGGIAFGLDHRITNGTPLRNYIYYVETARELLGLPPMEESEPGWVRMAF